MYKLKFQGHPRSVMRHLDSPYDIFLLEFTFAYGLIPSSLHYVPSPFQGHEIKSKGAF